MVAREKRSIRGRSINGLTTNAVCIVCRSNLHAFQIYEVQWLELRNEVIIWTIPNNARTDKISIFVDSVCAHFINSPTNPWRPPALLCRCTLDLPQQFNVHRPRPSGSQWVWSRLFERMCNYIFPTTATNARNKFRCYSYSYLSPDGSVGVYFDVVVGWRPQWSMLA